MRYAADNEEAAGIMNDGFIKVFKGLLSFVEPAETTVLEKVFLAWVKRIMINTGINHSKSLARRILPVSAVSPIDNIPSAQQNAAENMGYEELVKLVQKLSPAYRNTFSLFAIEGYTHEEIAGIMGISVGTSKSNLLKARRNLRKMLGTVSATKI